MAWISWKIWSRAERIKDVDGSIRLSHSCVHQTTSRQIHKFWRRAHSALINAKAFRTSENSHKSRWSNYSALVTRRHFQARSSVTILWAAETTHRCTVLITHHSRESAAARSSIISRNAIEVEKEMPIDALIKLWKKSHGILHAELERSSLLY